MTQCTAHFVPFLTIPFAKSINHIFQVETVKMHSQRAFSSLPTAFRFSYEFVYDKTLSLTETYLFFSHSTRCMLLFFLRAIAFSLILDAFLSLYVTCQKFLCFAFFCTFSQKTSYSLCAISHKKIGLPALTACVRRVCVCVCSRKWQTKAIKWQTTKESRSNKKTSKQTKRGSGQHTNTKIFHILWFVYDFRCMSLYCSNFFLLFFLFLSQLCLVHKNRKNFGIMQRKQACVTHTVHIIFWLF